ncbi:MAG: GLPGLI family protein [Candidatus Symbiothrix sp.]|nr:GLPGLI family protein [Candidatus Symbiothrix sp.]
MRQIFIIVLGILLFSADLQAQSQRRILNDFSKVEVLDKAWLVCRYRQSVIKDTVNDRKLQTEMLLEIGDQVSKYFEAKDSKDRKRENSDSQRQIMDSLRKNNSQSTLFFSNNALFRNYPEGKITIIEFIMLPACIYEETLLVPNWKLLSDTATISGYFCKKAETFFRGRNYEAWYTPEIPVSAGPWKFTGLPGLIFKVEDSNHYFSFECISVKKENHTTDIYIDRNKTVQITKKEYNRREKAYYDDPKGFLEATNSHVRIGTVLPAIQYIPLELTEN